MANRTIFARILLCLCFFATASHAEDPEALWNEKTCTQISFDALKDKAALLTKGKVYFDAKYKTIFGNRLLILNCDLTFSVSDPKQQKLAQQLKEKVDNIRIFGLLEKGKSGGMYVFQVKKLKQLKPDAELFEEVYQRLRNAKDFKGLYRLGRETLDKVKVYDLPKLIPLTSKAFRSAIELENMSLSPKDLEGHIRIAEKYLTLLNDKKGALKSFIEALKISPKNPVVLGKLKALPAIRYKGSWWLYKDYKKAEGFVLHRERWIFKERKEFLEVIAKRKQNPKKILRLTADYYDELARDGLIELGMNKREVAKSQGHADYVDCIVEGDTVYEQWCYEGKGSLYFESSILITKWD
jgi:hypothetical protein